jgi:DNA mismatch repair protein MutS
LVNASRFITTELKDFEKDLMNAESILSELEYNLFLEVREKILDNFENIKQISKKSAYIDF